MTPRGDVTAECLIAAELRQLPLTARGTTQVMHEPGPTLAPASASTDGRKKLQQHHHPHATPVTVRQRVRAAGSSPVSA